MRAREIVAAAVVRGPHQRHETAVLGLLLGRFGGESRLRRFLRGGDGLLLLGSGYNVRSLCLRFAGASGLLAQPGGFGTLFSGDGGVLGLLPLRISQDIRGLRLRFALLCGDGGDFGLLLLAESVLPRSFGAHLLRFGESLRRDRFLPGDVLAVAGVADRPEPDQRDQRQGQRQRARRLLPAVQAPLRVRGEGLRLAVVRPQRDGVVERRGPAGQFPGGDQLRPAGGEPAALAVRPILPDRGLQGLDRFVSVGRVGGHRTAGDRDQFVVPVRGGEDVFPGGHAAGQRLVQPDRLGASGAGGDLLRDLVVADVRAVAGGDLPQHRAQQVNVDGVGDRRVRFVDQPHTGELVVALLRRHVGRGAAAALVVRDAAGAGESLRDVGEAPVQDQHLTEPVELDVLRFEVVVDDAAVVGERDGVRDLQPDVEVFLLGQRPFGAGVELQHLVPAATAEDLHRVEQGAVDVPTEVVHRDDVRVFEFAGDDRLGGQAGFLARADAPLDLFQGDVPAEGPLFGPADDAHAALAQRGEHGVVGGEVGLGEARGDLPGRDGGADVGGPAGQRRGGGGPRGSPPRGAARRGAARRGAARRGAVVGEIAFRRRRRGPRRRRRTPAGSGATGRRGPAGAPRGPAVPHGGPAGARRRGPAVPQRGSAGAARGSAVADRSSAARGGPALAGRTHLPGRFVRGVAGWVAAHFTGGNVCGVAGFAGGHFAGGHVGDVAGHLPGGFVHTVFAAAAGEGIVVGEVPDRPESTADQRAAGHVRHRRAGGLQRCGARRGIAEEGGAVVPTVVRAGVRAGVGGG